MFYNKKHFALALLALSLFSSGCSNNHDFLEPQTVVNLSFDTNCLQEIPTFLELYADELVSDSTIRENFKCINDAIDYVKVKIKTDNKAYTVNQIKNFSNKFLFDENKDLDFFKDLVQLKSDFFGGSAEELTFSELDSIKAQLGLLENTLLLVKEDASELFFKKPFKNSKKKFDAVNTLHSYLQNILSSVESSLDLENLFEVVELVSENEDYSLLSPVLNLLRGSAANERFIKNEEKSLFLEIFKNYYSIFLDFKSSKDLNWETDRSDFHVLSRNFDQLMVLIGASLDHHPLKKWSNTDLKHFTSLTDFSSFELSEKTKEHMVDVLFGRYFSTGESVEFNTKTLKKITLSWEGIKSFIEKGESLEGHVGEEFPFVEEGVELFSLFTQMKWPSLLRKDRTLFILDSAHNVEFTFQSIFHASWQYTAAKLLVEGYSTVADERQVKGLTLKDVERAYLDLFVLLKEVEFLNEESRGGWFRIFNEGNLLVPSAKPDGVVEISEAAEYLAFMFSAYFSGELLGDSIKKECPNFVELCSFRLIQDSSDEMFPSFPGLVNFFSEELPEKSYELWQKSFEYIAKLANDDTNYVDSHWFRGTVGVQYIEVLFRKYDLNSSDTFNLEETNLAFNDFKVALKLLPQIKGTAAETNEKVLKSFFNFFVHKGRLPKLRNGRPTKEFNRYFGRCGTLTTSPKCQFESDRSSIMAILAYLTSVDGSDKKKTK